jgi:insulysin
MKPQHQSAVRSLIALVLILYGQYAAAFQIQSPRASGRNKILAALQSGNEVGADISDSSRLHEYRRRQLLLILASLGSATAATRSPAQALDVEATKPINSASLEFSGIIKPPLDECEYSAYTMENGLRVMLCSDPSPSYEAGAAMDVHVGACSDPSYLPGLAHFVEHMIFLGTKKYPKEDSFGEFLAANGGSSNAYTDSENTVYFFSINAEADRKLAEGLSRFGSFFSGPLFTDSATSRELNAIESENAKNLQSDVFREFQINKSRANSNHPFSKFFTGNKKTLLDGTKEQGIDLRSELIKFYNQYYSANQMTLAVVGPQPIDVLKRMVEDNFSGIPNKSVPKPEVMWTGIPPFSNEYSTIPSFQHIVEIVPVSDLRQVQIAWPIVYQSEADRLTSLLIKPSQYIAHLLGHEGPRSLLSFLKKRGWANTLGSSTNDVLSDFETYEVVVGLTSKGLAAVDNVIEAVYSYISLLRDQTIPDFIFKEVLQLAELQWRFLTKGGSGECKWC